MTTRPPEPPPSCCTGCRLPASHCICTQAPKLSAGLSIWLLLHPQERHKATNTGHLAATGLPGARSFSWQRRQPCQALAQRLQDPRFAPCLVFPARRERDGHRLLDRLPPLHRSPAFIILDGTWQQASRMFRLSPYLQQLPVLSLDPGHASDYTLRRPAQAGQLCTAEVVAELLRRYGHDRDARQLHNHYQRFCQHFLAARARLPAPEPAAI